jgi:hypothetical protein
MALSLNLSIYICICANARRDNNVAASKFTVVFVWKYWDTSTYFSYFSNVPKLGEGISLVMSLTPAPSSILDETILKSCLLLIKILIRYTRPD